MSKEPATISELEALLNSEDDRNVTINPDGTITVHPTEVGELRAEIERLRAALQKIAEVCPRDDVRHVARAALEPKP